MSHLLKLKRGHDESEEDYTTDDNDSVVTSGEEDYTDDDSFAGETTDEENEIEEDETDSEATNSDDEQPSIASRSNEHTVKNNQVIAENNQEVLENNQVVSESKHRLEQIQIVQHDRQAEMKREVDDEQVLDSNQQIFDNKREIDNTQVVDNHQAAEETAVAPPQSVVIEEFIYTETISQPPSTEDMTQKRIQEHKEYRRKLEEDPSFVPYVGLFWGHDDRYRDDTLTETRSPASLTEPRFSSTSGSNNQRATEYQRQLDPLMYKKWDHSGWEELLRSEEQEERRKRELIESGQLDSNVEYKTNHHHNKQRYPSRGRGRGGYQHNHHQGQRYPRTNNYQNRRDSTPKEEWPELNRNTSVENSHDPEEASTLWQNRTNITEDWGVGDDTPPAPPKTEDSATINAWGSVDRVQEVQPIVENNKPAETAPTDGWGLPSTSATDSIEGWDVTNITKIGTNGWQAPNTEATTPQKAENHLSASIDANSGNWAEQSCTKAANDDSWNKPTTDVTETSNKDWNNATNTTNIDNTTAMKNTDWNNTTTNTGWNTTSSTSNDWDNTTTTKTDWNTTTATNNDWNNTSTTNNDWNNTTISQTTGSLWDATSSSQRGTRKSEWDRSPLKRDDTKISSEEIPIEEKASSSWANVTPDVEVSTTPSSWTRRNYNSNDRHSGRGNYANSHNNDSTSHWRTNNNPNKVSSPAVPTKELTQDWNQKSASESARWDNTPAVTNESSGWNEQATSSTTIEPSSGWGETSIAVSTTADVNKESYGWGQPSTTATSSWTEQPKTESTDATTPVSSSTTNSSWNEPSKIIETVPLSSTKVASSWNESSKVAETTTTITTTSTTSTTTTTTTTPSTITSSNWNEPSKTTATATIPISSTTDTSSGWGEPSIAVAATSGWGEQSTNATVTAASTDATPVSTETSDLNESTIPVNDPVQSSRWNSTVPEMTSDWDLPTTASTTKTTTAPHSWTDSRDISVTKDNSSTWSTPVESSGWGESTRKESTFGGWSNSRSNNSSNWNSDREANNKSKPNDQPARKGRGYLSQKMESSISTSPSPPIIVADQHETLENTTETSGSAWERFHQQGDSDSDVEIILEAEEEPEWLKHEQVLGMTAPNDGAVQLQVTHAPAPPSSTLHMPAQSPLTSNENSPRSKHVYRQYDSSSPRPESSLKHSSSNSNKNPRKPRRNFDDNWRHRDDHQYNEEQPQYNNTTNGPAMYYPAPMNGANITYVPMIPNANGNPMYAMPFPMGTSPTGQSISPHHSDDNRSTSSQQFYPSPPTVGPNGAIQLPPGYEANGMVYYGMDPSAMYPPQPFYYYAAPMPMGTGNNTNGALPPRPPPPAQQQMMYHSLPTEDSHHHKLHTSSPQQHMLLEEDDGWGPSPSIQDGEGEWSNNKKSSPLMDKSNSRYSNSNNSSPYYFYQ